MHLTFFLSWALALSLASVFDPTAIPGDLWDVIIALCDPFDINAFSAVSHTLRSRILTGHRDLYDGLESSLAGFILPSTPILRISPRFECVVRHVKDSAERMAWLHLRAGSEGVCRHLLQVPRERPEFSQTLAWKLVEVSGYDVEQEGLDPLQDLPFFSFTYPVIVLGRSSALSRHIFRTSLKRDWQQWNAHSSSSFLPSLLQGTVNSIWSLAFPCDRFLRFQLILHHLNLTEELNFQRSIFFIIRINERFGDRKYASRLEKFFRHMMGFQPHFVEHGSVDFLDVLLLYVHWEAPAGPLLRCLESEGRVVEVGMDRDIAQHLVPFIQELREAKDASVVPPEAIPLYNYIQRHK